MLACALPACARIALVIGNSNYPQSPLVNPVNDAQAMAQVLRAAGFDVALLLDQNRDTMLAAINDFGGRLAGESQPGVFYYAGHGMQLNWRNYMLPVDVNILSARDVEQQSVDLGVLMELLDKATPAKTGGPNIVILDACRDNPFGDAAEGGARGLAKTMTPNSIVLSFATAAGEVAEDSGTGANGLFTENLLREIKVEGQKIEDVFKRVRLAVRVQSGDRQVPWEISNLEREFSFLPRLGARPAEEIEIRFQEESIRWEAAKASDRIADMVQFMRDYPSGNFSELAQYRLEALMDDERVRRNARRTVPEARAARVRAEREVRLLLERERQIMQAIMGADTRTRLTASLEREDLARKKFEASREVARAREQEERAATPQATPEPGSVAALLAAALSKAREESRASDYPPAGPGEIRQGWQNGDLMVYREDKLSGLFRLPTVIRHRVSGASSTRVVMRNGVILDHFGYPRGLMRESDIASTDMQMLVRDYQLGKTWSTRFKTANLSGTEYWTRADAKVVERLPLVTEAGTFETYKVVIQGEQTGSRTRKFSQTWWIDVLSRKPVAYERIEMDLDGTVRDHRKGMLLAFENDGPGDKD